MALPDFTSTARAARPWHHIGHRVLKNPFVPERVAPGAGKARWCQTCHGPLDFKQESRFEGAVYATKEWCNRCGTVINWGVFADDQKVTDPSVRDRARAWASAREADRR